MSSNPTIKQQVHQIIAKHGLHELLERIADLVHEEAEAKNADDLNQVVIHLEHALSQAQHSTHHTWV